jgi:triosephosphate isomerase
MSARRKFVAGNWKMHLDRAGAVRLALDVHNACGHAASPVQVAVCPPFVYLEAVGAALRAAKSPIALGAQDCYHEKQGAFTGEIAPGMLRDIGCSIVILGHSERRHVIGETDELIAKKTKAALDAGLHVILCVGETLAQREAAQTDSVNERQTKASLAALTPAELAQVTIAYEPVWAIGTGKTAKPADAQDAHKKIRAVVAAMHGPAIAAAMRIQYGGSVKPDNAAELLSQPDIDGGLIGGAALKAADFAAIVKAGG